MVGRGAVVAGGRSEGAAGLQVVMTLGPAGEQTGDAARSGTRPGEQNLFVDDERGGAQHTVAAMSP